MTYGIIGRLHPLCQSALDYFARGEDTAERFVYICTMTSSATTEWAFDIVALIGG